MLTAAASAALEARGRAIKAQEAAMGALNLPSASDVERLTRRLRSVSQRLEAIEDSLDRVSDRVEGIGTLEVLDCVTMQLFVRGDCTMIAAPVQRDVDGVSKGSHHVRVPMIRGQPNPESTDEPRPEPELEDQNGV